MNGRPISWTIWSAKFDINAIITNIWIAMSWSVHHPSNLAYFRYFASIIIMLPLPLALSSAETPQKTTPEYRYWRLNAYGWWFHVRSWKRSGSVGPQNQNSHLIKTKWMLLLSPDARGESCATKTTECVKMHRIFWSGKMKNKKLIMIATSTGLNNGYHWLKGIYTHYMWLHLICHSVMSSV